MRQGVASFNCQSTRPWTCAMSSRGTLSSCLPKQGYHSTGWFSPNSLFHYLFFFKGTQVWGVLEKTLPTGWCHATPHNYSQNMATTGICNPHGGVEEGTCWSKSMDCMGWIYRWSWLVSACGAAGLWLPVFFWLTLWRWCQPIIKQWPKRLSLRSRYWTYHSQKSLLLCPIALRTVAKRQTTCLLLSWPTWCMSLVFAIYLLSLATTWPQPLTALWTGLWTCFKASSPSNQRERGGFLRT